MTESQILATTMVTLIILYFLFIKPWIYKQMDIDGSKREENFKQVNIDIKNREEFMKQYGKLYK